MGHIDTLSTETAFDYLVNLITVVFSSLTSSCRESFRPCDSQRSQHLCLCDQPLQMDVPYAQEPPITSLEPGWKKFSIAPVSGAGWQRGSEQANTVNQNGFHSHAWCHLTLRLKLDFYSGKHKVLI